jgi:hypothetical protein
MPKPKNVLRAVASRRQFFNQCKEKVPNKGQTSGVPWLIVNPLEAIGKTHRRIEKQKIKLIQP